MDRIDGRDLRVGDRPPRGLDLDRDARGRVPAQPAQHVLARQQVALVETGVDDPGETATQVLRDRWRRGPVEHALEVGSGEPSAGHPGDLREHVEVAVADLFVAMTL
jgi:hypothetical protein